MSMHPQFITISGWLAVPATPYMLLLDTCYKRGTGTHQWRSESEMYADAKVIADARNDFKGDDVLKFMEEMIQRKGYNYKLVTFIVECYAVRQFYIDNILQ